LSVELFFSHRLARSLQTWLGNTCPEPLVPPTAPTAQAASLRREIVWVLALKLVLIVAIKLAFFSDPPRPDGAATAQAVLSSSPSNEHRPAEKVHE
jgi:hypothetical protein